MSTDEPVSTQRPAQAARPSGFVSGLLLALACLLLYTGLPNIGNAVRAATLDGVRGTFTAVRLNCVSHPGHQTCEWSGRFRSADKTIERSTTTLYGQGRGTLKNGQRTQAVDVGNPGRVYSPEGSHEWIFTAALLLAGYATLTLLAKRHLMPPRQPPARHADPAPLPEETQALSSDATPTPKVTQG